MEEKPIYEDKNKRIVKTWTFKTNWNNKLNCEFYTTFRFFNSGKIKRGDLVRCKLMSGDKCLKDEIKQVYFYTKTTLMDVNPWLCYLDTGYGYARFIAMIGTMYKKYHIDYKTQLFAFYLLGPVNKEIP